MKLTNTLKENNIAYQLQKKYPGLTLNLYHADDTITISKFVLGLNVRSHGIGTTIMRELCSYADANDITLILDPTTVFGASSIKRLQQFYKRFGFVLNKGTTKNSNIKRQMYRLPNT